MILTLLLLVQPAAPTSDPNTQAKQIFETWKRLDPAPQVEKLGPGPHTLVIYNTKGVTRFEYKTGPACQKARDSVRKQVTPAPDPRVIYHNPGVTAVCVPR